MVCMVKMPLKGVVGGRALNGHGHYVSDHGKSWKKHGIVFLNFCGNPVAGLIRGFSSLAYETLTLKAPRKKCI